MRVFRLADLEIDPSRGELRRAGRPLRVEARVATLIFQLVEAEGAVVSQEAVYERLWPGVSVSRDALYRVLKEARAALGDDGARQSVIKTLKGRGLRWIAPVEVVEPAQSGVHLPSFESVEENYAAGRIDIAREQAQQLASALSGADQASRRAQALLRASDLMLHGQVDREWMALTKRTLEALPSDASQLRAGLLSRQAYQLYWSRDPKRAREALESARLLAEVEDHAETLAWVALVEHMLSAGGKVDPGARAIAERGVEHAKRAKAPQLELWSREQVAHDAMEAADLAAVELQADAVDLLSEEHPLTWPERVRTMLRLHFGDLPGAERALTAAFSALSKQGPEVFQYLGGPMLWLRYEQGRLEEVLPLLRNFVGQIGDVPVWRAALARGEWDAGDRDAARSEYEGLAAGSFRGVLGNVFSWLALGHLAELCANFGDAERADWLAEQLSPCSGRLIVAPRATFSLGPADYLLGRLAYVAEHFDAALELLSAALAQSQALRSRPCQARCHLMLALLAEREGAQAKAAEHMRRARGIREALGVRSAA